MTMPIADLHCDLLCYLENSAERTPFDPEVRCSIPQLKAGSVKWQVMAAFSETGHGSSSKGANQFAVFKSLPEKYPEQFHLVTKNNFHQISESIGVLLSIENASTLWAEEDPLEGFKRLDSLTIAYLSLTWNGENRFGGGAHTSVGLKSDGMHLLDHLHGKRIALDLSHASDALAEEALGYIDRKILNIPVIASHSNFRSVTDVRRNLPDELAKEIFKRGGVIGLNFVRDFVGASDPRNFVRHLEHGLKLGGTTQLCLGADFYYGGDIPASFRKPPEKMFFPDFASAATYPALIDLWRQEGIQEECVERISHKNLAYFLAQRIL